MARKRDVRPEVAAQKSYLDGVAKNLVEKLYGPDGPPHGTRFADLEELAVQLGHRMAQELMSRALERQAAVQGSVAETPCPTCQRPTALADPEPRVVTTRVGEAEWSEPRGDCPSCRRSFFPSVPKSGD